MKRVTVRLMHLSFAAVLILLAACGGDTQVADPTPTQVADGDVLLESEWVLSHIDGGPALDETMVTLEFQNDEAGGYSGCNWYGAAYQLSGNSITFDEISSTARLCDPPVIVDQEVSFQELLRISETFELDGSELSLLNAGGETILAFTRREPAAMDPANLVGKTWLLRSFDEIPASSPPSLLTFDDESSFSTRDGCYNYAGDYTARGDRLNFQATGATAYACLQPMDVQTRPANLLAALDDVAYYRLSGDGAALTLIHYDGKQATFGRVDSLPPDAIWSVGWVLNSIIVDGEADPLIEDTQVTLSIPNPSLQLGEAQPVSGSAGCNTYQAVMTAGNDTLTFSDIIVTEMACQDPPGIMEQEQRYLELLGQVTSHNFFEEDALQLVTADGTTLVFYPPS